MNCLEGLDNLFKPSKLQLTAIFSYASRKDLLSSFKKLVTLNIFIL